MKKAISTLVVVLLGLSFTSWADETEPAKTDRPIVRLETSLGDITLELDRRKAPKTVDNFLSYVQNGFYNSTIFHRVMKGFMIQGGGLTQDMVKKETQDTIVNEADNGSKNRVGTVAMARLNEPHSATAQFFINTADNVSLNHRNKSFRGWGYCVFGKVTKGLDVVYDIEGASVTTKTGRENVPATPIIIKRAVMVKR